LVYVAWLRVLSAFVGAAVLLLAFIIFVVGGVMSPDSHDGCSAPAGDIQFWLAVSAVLGWICAAATSIGYASTGGREEGRATILFGAGAVVLTGAWLIYLTAAC
jgi:hypothetical protein